MPQDKSLHILYCFQYLEFPPRICVIFSLCSFSAKFKVTILQLGWGFFLYFFLSKRRCKINGFFYYVQEWPSMFYNFSLKIGARQCMSSIKTLIPPGVFYRRHVCVCMYVCGHTGIIYLFPQYYISFYGVAPQTKALLKRTVTTTVPCTVLLDRISEQLLRYE